LKVCIECEGETKVKEEGEEKRTGTLSDCVETDVGKTMRRIASQ